MHSPASFATRKSRVSTSSPMAMPASISPSAENTGSFTLSNASAAWRADAIWRRGWSRGYGMGPGHILFEIQEASQAPVVVGKVSRGPLELSAIWKAAQRMTEKPVKIGTISAQCLAGMMWNEHYADDHELILDLSDMMNEEFHEMVSAGLLNHSDRGAEAPLGRSVGRCKRQGACLPDRGTESGNQGDRRRNLGPHVLGKSESAAFFLGNALLRTGLGAHHGDRR